MTVSCQKNYRLRLLSPQSEAVKKQQKVVGGDQETPSTSVDRLVTRKKPHSGQTIPSTSNRAAPAVAPHPLTADRTAQHEKPNVTSARARTKRVHGIEQQRGSDSE